MQFRKTFRRTFIGAAFTCSAVVFAAHEARAQGSTELAPEVVAALYVKEKILPPGQIAFDSRVARARAVKGAVPRHEAALTAQIAKALKARVATVEDVTKCKTAGRCHLDNATSVMWLSRVEGNTSNMIVVVSFLVDTPVGAMRPFAAYEYLVLLERRANGWVAVKARDANKS